ncbi:MAG: biotin synthase BioB, partial [Hydrogenophaga sp.]|nr:biotin synthase BioB [Hydrogenophaga sp.]MDP3165542.1 biotin synthase BioB [Hydrogenophaga sp.]MDP3813423.1 biotin synthase BioB [Hydrogenophaga sp.]
MTTLSATAQPLHFHATQTPAPVTEAGTGAWSVDAVQALFDLPFSELMHRAQTVHREHFDPTEVELATLLSVKTGG